MENGEIKNYEETPVKKSGLLSKILLIALAVILVAIIVWVVVASLTREDEVVNREYDEAEVISAAKELIGDTLVLNEIFWGKGIPYTEDANLAEGNYFPASEVYLASIGVTTVEDIKNLARAVYSDNICDWVFETVFSSVTDTGNTPMLARYVQKMGGDNLDVPEYILVYRDAEYWLTDTVEYNLENIEVIGSEGERVKIKTLVTVTNPDGKVMNINKELALVEEADGWRLDTPTYARYYNPSEQTNK